MSSAIPFWEVGKPGKVTQIVNERKRLRLERDLKRIEYDIHLFTTTGESSLVDEERAELADLLAEEAEIIQMLEDLVQ